MNADACAQHTKPLLCFTASPPNVFRSIATITGWPLPITDMTRIQLPEHDSKPILKRNFSIDFTILVDMLHHGRIPVIVRSPINVNGLVYPVTRIRRVRCPTQPLQQLRKVT
mmetsp:Transcript_32289/g.56462  ORF Transcript_32289/g.56462 Transcript_32289/m.56462 type:complete len:112 (-) Transcript_32289:512-847(-)